MRFRIRGAGITSNSDRVHCRLYVQVQKNYWRIADPVAIDNPDPLRL
jgi:hypothetical protein